jgi:hypothetical protein
MERWACAFQSVEEKVGDRHATIFPWNDMAQLLVHKLPTILCDSDIVY